MTIELIAFKVAGLLHGGGKKDFTMGPYLHYSPGGAHTRLGSRWVQAGAFTVVAIWIRLESEVSCHYHCKRVIHLLCFQTKPL